MLIRAVLSAALAAALAWPHFAFAASEAELAQLRAEIMQMKNNYESRIQSLEKRLQAAEAKVSASPSSESQATSSLAASTPSSTASGAARPALPPAASAPSSSYSATLDTGTAAGGSRFNPSTTLILGGTYANLSQDPDNYRLQGFLPGSDELGPGKRGLSLGESELRLAASIDPRFSGQMTVALAPDNSVAVEEAYIQSLGGSHGLQFKAGRFLSSIGYLNSQHRHVWDFADAPLIYQAFLGGQYNPDGVQIRWLAPTDRFFQLGAELGSGGNFPGSERNKNGAGSAALFAHVGDDIGESSSWRVGMSYLRTSAANRSYDDIDINGTEVKNAFSGTSHVWMLDGIYKWAPGGNATQTNFKLQGEYFRRNERGTLAYDTTAQSIGSLSGSYRSAQSGWYLQGVYQFMPGWRTGLRYDKLYSGTPEIGLLNSGAIAAGDLGRLAAYDPSRTSLMVDYSPSEFSRLRLQVARDRSRPDATDTQIFLQYIMSLGAHGAHSF